MVIRVGVIGCGAAGLAALRHLAARPSTFQGVGFETSTGVGGTWRYTDKVGIDTNGLPVQTSMYKNLRTNIPKEVMGFPGYPFPSDLPSFPEHKDVLKYLKDYSDHYDLEKYIKFSTKVDSVAPLSFDNKTAWKVSYSSVGCPSQSENSIFDAIIVCNGHYSVPLVPTLEGMEDFKGTIVHSHDYRVPDPFKDKVVVCLGGAASGQDICLDIATQAKQVTISHNKPRIESTLPYNVDQKPGIAKLKANSVVFKNGEEQQADILLLCTGYRYNFPFLTEECGLKIVEERITPLYKHIIHSKFHTLSFIGMCKIICPFPQFDNQVKFVLSSLDGTQKLPSTEEMEHDIDSDYKNRLSEGLPHRYAHFMGPRQWAYNDTLAELAGFDPIPKAIQNLYDEVHRTRVKDLQNYKQKQYRIVGESNYEIVQA
ncbi:uncharacterized protein LOC132716918 [Ruditapes philippinarum]|uniref:uncharacterized protein LOC132716918 n=1 Tax=Ruditapes philippinarum TaxID=129788 RepID=UPI00295AC99B|nr:uncharacterized protein LOC132716918 [Ruditapes philippinarum]XP_060556236.1 uncharacterized protein LOC132716918 [Ruditapes philippinarum]